MNARSIGGIFALAGLVVSGPGGAQEIINLPGEDRHLELGFEELYTVGLVSGEDWEQFGNVRTVGFDGAGQLYIFDNVADRITVMRPNGEFVRAFGTCQRFWDTRRMGLGKCFLRGGFTARTRIHYGNR